jgi:hypothetical protein
MSQELLDAIADMEDKKAAFFEALAIVNKLSGNKLNVFFLEQLLEKDCEVKLR